MQRHLTLLLDHLLHFSSINLILSAIFLPSFSIVIFCITCHFRMLVNRVLHNVVSFEALIKFGILPSLQLTVLLYFCIPPISLYIYWYSITPSRFPSLSPSISSFHPCLFLSLFHSVIRIPSLSPIILNFPPYLPLYIYIPYLSLAFRISCLIQNFPILFLPYAFLSPLLPFFSTLPRCSHASSIEHSACKTTCFLKPALQNQP